MDGYWLSAPRIADLAELSNRAVLKRLQRNAIPGRKRAKGKGLEYNVSNPLFFDDWRQKIEAKLGRTIPVQDCDEPPQAQLEKGFRIVIEVRFEEL
jgi:hypothetical protein